MDKVKLNIKDGKATITEGGNTTLGKLLTNHKGKIKFKKKEIDIAQ